MAELDEAWIAEHAGRLIDEGKDDSHIREFIDTARAVRADRANMMGATVPEALISPRGRQDKTGIVQKVLAGPQDALAPWLEMPIADTMAAHGISFPPALAVNTSDPAQVQAMRQRQSEREDAGMVAAAQARGESAQLQREHTAETAHLDAEAKRLNNNPAALEMIAARQQQMGEQQAQADGRMMTETATSLGDAWDGIKTYGGGLAHDAGEQFSRLPRAINATQMATMEGKGGLEQIGAFGKAFWSNKGPEGSAVVDKAWATGKPGARTLHDVAQVLGGTDLSDVTDQIERHGRDVVLPMTPLPLGLAKTARGVESYRAAEALRLAKLRQLSIQSADTVAQIAERLPQLAERAEKIPWLDTFEGQLNKDLRMGLGIRVQGPLGFGGVDIPIVPGRVVAKLGRPLDIALAGARKSPAVAWAARAIRMPSLLTQHEQDALMMEHFNAKDMGNLKAGIELEYRADQKGMDAARARFERSFPGEDALLNPLEKQDRAMVRVMEQGRGEALEDRVAAGIAGKTINEAEGKLILKVHKDFDEALQLDIAAGVPIMHLGNEDLTYLHHAMTPEAKKELLSRPDLDGTPYQRASKFFSSLRKAADDPGFARARTIDLDTLAANALAKKMGLKADLFHTNVAYIAAVRKLASIRARGAASLVRGLGEHFGVANAMPPLAELTMAELKQDSKYVFRTVYDTDAPAEARAAARARHDALEVEMARRTRPMEDALEQVPVDAPPQPILPRTTHDRPGFDAEHLRIQEGAQDGLESGLTGSDHPGAPLDRRRTLGMAGVAEPDYAITREGERMNISMAEQRREDWREQNAERPIPTREEKWLRDHPPEDPEVTRSRDAATELKTKADFDYKPFDERSRGGAFAHVPGRKRRTIVPDDWQIIKDGQLKGVAMPPELFPYMRRLNELTDPGKSNIVTDAWHAYNHWWKAWTLNPRPAFHTRNAFSSFIQNYIGGTASVRDILGSFVSFDRANNSKRVLTNLETGETVATMEQALQEMERLGVTRSTFSGSTERVYENAKRQLEQPTTWDLVTGRGAQASKHTVLGKNITVPAAVNRAGRLVQAWVPLTAVDEANSLALHFGQMTGDFVEQQARRQHFFGRLERGDSFEQAALSVEKHHFDYTKMSPQERTVREAIPFLSFMKNSLALHLEGMFMQQPEKYARINRIWGSMRAPDAPDDKFMAPWQRDTSTLVTSMGRDKNGKPTGIGHGVQLSGWDPTQDWSKLLGAEGFHPIAKAAWTVATGRDWRGNKLEDMPNPSVLGGNPSPVAGAVLKSTVPAFLQDLYRLHAFGGSSAKALTADGKRVEQQGTAPWLNLLAPFGVPGAQTTDGVDSGGSTIGKVLMGATDRTVDFPRAYQSALRDALKRFQNAKRNEKLEAGNGNTREAANWAKKAATILQIRTALIRDYTKTGLPEFPE